MASAILSRRPISRATLLVLVIVLHLLALNAMLSGRLRFHRPEMRPPMLEAQLVAEPQSDAPARLETAPPATPAKQVRDVPAPRRPALVHPRQRPSPPPSLLSGCERRPPPSNA